jgi:hypothetical protein
MLKGEQVSLRAMRRSDLEHLCQFKSGCADLFHRGISRSEWKWKR